MNRGERDIRRQLEQMEAQGLGDYRGVTSNPAMMSYAPSPTRTYRAWLRSNAGPGRREWWRSVVGAILLVGGVVIWLVGHRLQVPAVVTRGGAVPVPVNFGDTDRVNWARLELMGIGIGTALAGLVWLWNQVRPKRRTYRPRDVVVAVIVGVLIVVGIVLYVLATLHSGLHPFFLLIVSVTVLQSMFITRTTGPDGARCPLRDPRGDVIRFLTPWPVMIAISAAWCVYQAVLLTT